MDKEYSVTFKLPQLPAAHCWQNTTVTAANFGNAANRAWAIIKKRPIVKGRRLKNTDIKIEIIGDSND